MCVGVYMHECDCVRESVCMFSPATDHSTSSDISVGGIFS